MILHVWVGESLLYYEWTASSSGEKIREEQTVALGLMAGIGSLRAEPFSSNKHSNIV